MLAVRDALLVIDDVLFLGLEVGARVWMCLVELGSC